MSQIKSGDRVRIMPLHETILDETYIVGLVAKNGIIYPMFYQPTLEIGR